MTLANLCILALCGLMALALGAACARRLPALTAPSGQVGRLELAVLAGVLAIGSLAIYGSFLAGRASFAYRDVGLDTVDQYVPFYVNVIESLRSGTFGAWNFEYGLGTPITSCQSWLLDPFNVALLPLGVLLGSSWLSPLLTVVQIMKVAVCGLTFDALLKRYCETPLARVVGASCFAFGGYLLLWGQHYWLGSVYALFPVTVLAFERLMERWSAPRFACCALVTAVFVGWSAYCGFMALLGTAAYCLLRLVRRAHGQHQVRQVAVGTLGLCLPVLCGCLLGGIALVPYARYLLGETSRVSSGAQASLLASALGYLTEFVPLRWVPMLASRLLGSGLIATGTDIPAEVVPATSSFAYVNCYELINLGFGALAIILLAQFVHWALTEASHRDRALVLVATALVVLYCVNDFLPALFNLFVEPKYRSSFVLALPVCLALTVGWERRVQVGRVNLAALAVGTALTAAVLTWSLAVSVNARRLCVAYLLVAAAFVALVLAGRGRASSPGIVMALAGLAVAGSVLDGFYVTQVRATCTSADFPARNSEATADTEEALSWLAQEDPSLYRVEKTYTEWCFFNDSLVEGYSGTNAYNSTTDGDVVAFYRSLWPDALVTSSAYQDFRNDPDGHALISQLGVRYLLSREPIDSGQFTLVNQVGGVYVYRNEGAASMLFSRDVLVGEGTLQSLPSQEARQAAVGRALVVPDEVARQAEGVPNGSVTSELSQSAPDTVTGTLSADADAVACLLVPHTAGWSVRVDGQPVETFRADLGFIGLRVSAGEHTIEAHYELPGLGEGAALSAGGLALTALCCVVGTRVAGRSRGDATGRDEGATR